MFMKNAEMPLKGIKVVDLSMYIAAPMAGRVLAEWGAEVIKVEPPSGDLWRYNGPLGNMPLDDDFNPIYQIGNQCKKHLALDLKKPKGKEVLMRLLADADVFITNFRTEALKKMGLSYEEISDQFPKLIYAHITGYGDKGPDKDKPGYDLIAFWTRSGLLADLGQAGTPPLNGPSALGDAPSSTFFACGILGALVRQQRTGIGCKVSTSLFASALWTASMPITGAQEQFGDPWPRSRETDPISPCANTYQCADGEWVFISLIDIENRWSDLGKALNQEEWVNNPQYTQKYVLAHKKEIIREMEELMLKRDSSEWEEVFEKFDIPHQRVKHFREQVEDPQAWDNGYLYNQTFQSGDSCVMVNNPIQFSDVENTSYPPVGYIGENTVEVLSRSGYSQEEIDTLIDEKVTATTIKKYTTKREEK